MSASIVIGPALLDVAVLVQAIGEVCAAASAIESVHEAYQEVQKLKTSDGKVHDVVGVFTDAVGRRAGVQRASKGYRIISDCHGLAPGQKKRQENSVRQIVQRYAYRKTLKELQAQGYVVAEEEKRPDGTVRIVVRKW